MSITSLVTRVAFNWWSEPVTQAVISKSHPLQVHLRPPACSCIPYASPLVAEANPVNTCDLLCCHHAPSAPPQGCKQKYALGNGCENIRCSLPPASSCMSLPPPRPSDIHASQAEVWGQRGYKARAVFLSPPLHAQFTPMCPDPSRISSTRAFMHVAVILTHRDSVSFVTSSAKILSARLPARRPMPMCPALTCARSGNPHQRGCRGSCCQPG